MSKIEVNAIEPQSGTTLTLGASGDTIALAAGATSSGFGATYNGAINWDTTAKTTGFTAVSGVGYFCNTTGGAFTVTLPLSPSAGAVVGFKDYAQTWVSNNLTIGRNGSNIEGSSNNSIQTTSGQAITLIYVDSTKGWVIIDEAQVSQLGIPGFITATGGTILTCGDFKTHVFTGPGTFTVSSAGNSAGSNSVDYLVVAGGGGGGNRHAGGGGAGGFRQNYPSPAIAGLPVIATSYPITVGAGGAPGSCCSTSIGGSGNNAIFSTITSAGGGGGMGGGTNNGAPGGSGGGARNGGIGGTGNTPPVSPSQGNNGANGPPVDYNGSGGGGAGGAGSNSKPGGGDGGIGSPIATAFFGPTSPSYGTPGPAAGRYFSGGGGGGSYQGVGSPGPIGSGGSGGGGSGGAFPTTPTGGTINTGGGGGGGGGSPSAPGPSCVGGTGGSGIVAIRYKYQ